MTQPINHPKQRVAGRVGKKSAPGKTPAKLLVAMTGKAIAAKTATGDEPVFAYIASLPQPQCGIAERIDALTAKMRVRGAYRRALVSSRVSRFPVGRLSGS
jgi:hypothetical protein